MRPGITLCTIPTIGLLLFLCASEAVCHEPDLRRLARQAVIEYSTRADGARAELRAAGPAGLRALLDVHAEVLASAQEIDPESLNSNVSWRGLCAALDAVGRARDNHAARLYWFTDLEQAKAAARAENKPILSLRLLGNLDEEYSCANSRFFRTVLYADAEVSKLLRERFVLHWQSVRPVPRVTIDFGDGRVLERTITGNSIHYVLDADGCPVDALPGLYSPHEFRRHVGNAANVVASWRNQPKPLRESRLKKYHAFALSSLRQHWISAITNAATPAESTALDLASFPRAETAAPIAVSKMAVEAPILSATRVDDARFERASETLGWERVLAARPFTVHLGEGSLRLMRSKSSLLGSCPGPEQLASGNDAAVVANFKRLIALDTLRNEYLLHREIHQWFAEDAVTDLDQLNARVYAELLLTPDDDPWLGLLPRDVYTALPDDGQKIRTSSPSTSAIRHDTAAAPRK